MKALAFGDIQIHNYKQFDNNGSRLENCLDVLDVMFEYADKKGIKYLLFTGDWFDMQKVIPIVVINHTVKRLKRLFEDFPAIKIIGVSGNHDYGTQKHYGKHVETSMEFLAEIFDNFILIDDEVTNVDGVDIYGLPYYQHSEDYFKQLETFDIIREEIPNTTSIILTHATVTGYDNIPGSIDANDPRFNGFDLILSGDIHKKKWCAPNFLMTGCPIHRDGGDAGDDKGFWVVDTDTDWNGEGDFKRWCKFVSLNKLFPEFVYKTEGEKLTAEDKENYIVWRPVYKGGDIDNDSVDTEQYDDSLAPKELVKNFCNTVEEGNDKILQVGLAIIDKIK